MKVYIVFSGEYSDRETQAVFDEKSAAENHIENQCEREADGTIRSYSHFDIEEWEVGSDCPLSGRTMWRVDMYKNGSTEYRGREPNGAEPKLDFCEVYTHEKGFEPAIKIICICDATCEEGAVKITNEKRAMAIASGEWDRREAEILARRK